MARIPTPIPQSLVATLRTIFAGSWTRVLWKLFVLATGAFLALWIVSTTSSYFVMAIVGIVLTFALSSTVRSILIDIWRGAFWAFKP